MFYFDADKGGSGSGAEVEPGNPASTPNEEAKTYTQAELDRLFAERAKQASSGERGRILEALGVKNLDEATKLVKQVREAEQAQMSEADRLKAKLAELEGERERTQRAQRETTTRYEIMLQAQKLGIVDPDDAYRLLDLKSLEYDENGRPTNVEKALRALLVSKPYLAGSGQTSATKPPGGTSKNHSSDPVIAAARKAAGLPD